MYPLSPLPTSTLDIEIQNYYERRRKFKFSDLNDILGAGHALADTQLDQVGAKIDGYTYSLDTLIDILTPWPKWKILIPNIWNHFQVKSKYPEFFKWCLDTGFANSAKCYDRWQLLFRCCEQQKLTIQQWQICRNYILDEMSIFFAKIYCSPPVVIKKQLNKSNLETITMKYENFKQILKPYSFPVPEAVTRKVVPPSYPPANAATTTNKITKKTFSQTTITSPGTPIQTTPGPSSSNNNNNNASGSTNNKKHYQNLGEIFFNDTIIGKKFEKTVFQPCSLEDSNSPYLTQNFNLWNGFDYEFSKEQVKDYDDWNRIHFVLNHIKYSWCDSEEEFNNVLAWMAMLLQYPWIKLNVCLCIGGNQGSGKSTILNLLGKIIGADHYVAISKLSDLTGDFTSLVNRRILIFVDDVVLQTQEAVNILKNFITNNKERVRYMQVDPTQTDSFASFAIANNDFERLISIDSDSRRYFIVKSDLDGLFQHPFFKDFYASYPIDSTRDQKKRLYFETLHNSMSHQNWTGLKTLANFLYKIPLQKASYNPTNFPKTSLQFLNQMNSMDTMYQWWFLCLERKYIVPTTYVDQHSGKVITLKRWKAKLFVTDMFKEYKKAIGELSATGSTSGGGRSNRSKGALTDWKFRTKLTDICPGIVIRCKTNNIYEVDIPTLEECVRHFEDKVNGARYYLKEQSKANTNVKELFTCFTTTQLIKIGFNVPVLQKHLKHQEKEASRGKALLSNIQVAASTSISVLDEEDSNTNPPTSMNEEDDSSSSSSSSSENEKTQPLHENNGSSYAKNPPSLQQIQISNCSRLLYCAKQKNYDWMLNYLPEKFFQLDISLKEYFENKIYLKDEAEAIASNNNNNNSVRTPSTPFQLSRSNSNNNLIASTPTSSATPTNFSNVAQVQLDEYGFPLQADFKRLKTIALEAMASRKATSTPTTTQSSPSPSPINTNSPLLSIPKSMLTKQYSLPNLKRQQQISSSSSSMEDMKISTPLPDLKEQDEMTSEEEQQEKKPKKKTKVIKQQPQPSKKRKIQEIQQPLEEVFSSSQEKLSKKKKKKVITPKVTKPKVVKQPKKKQVSLFADLVDSEEEEQQQLPPVEDKKVIYTEPHAPPPPPTILPLEISSSIPFSTLHDSYLMKTPIPDFEFNFDLTDIDITSPEVAELLQKSDEQWLQNTTTTTTPTTTTSTTSPYILTNNILTTPLPEEEEDDEFDENPNPFLLQTQQEQ